jgi:hypothetical protein
LICTLGDSSTPQSFQGALPPWAHYQGSAHDPLGTLSGPQTPRLLTHPLTTNPGSAPDSILVLSILVRKSTGYGFKYTRSGIFTLSQILQVKRYYQKNTIGILLKVLTLTLEFTFIALPSIYQNELGTDLILLGPQNWLKFYEFQGVIYKI